MNTTPNTKTKRLVAALGVAAAAAVAPALLFAGAGTAHADDSCYGSLAGSYYCSPRPDSPQTPEQLEPNYEPLPNPYERLGVPGCSGGPLAAIAGALSGDGCGGE